MPSIQVTDHHLAALAQEAATSPRRRKNWNLHPQLDDPVQRFLNAIEPDSYVRPHRHAGEQRWELFVILTGRVAVLCLDDDGRVTERIELSPEGPVRAIEIPGNQWHALVAMASGSCLFEFKQGPYSAIADKDFATWAPREGEEKARTLLERYKEAQPGETLRD